MKTLAKLTVGILALGISACDGGTSPAEGDARMEVAMRGGDAPASASTAPAGGPTFSHTGAQGTIDVRARVYVRSSTGAWVAVTEAAQGSVDAAGHAAAETFARARVRADSYTRVRIVFERVDARLSGSLQISTGLLNGTVTVRSASGSHIVVERDLALTTRAGATTRLLVNLNADAWLDQADAGTRTVSEAAFRSAVQVSGE